MLRISISDYINYTKHINNYRNKSTDKKPKNPSKTNENSTPSTNNPTQTKKNNTSCFDHAISFPITNVRELEIEILFKTAKNIANANTHNAALVHPDLEIYERLETQKKLITNNSVTHIDATDIFRSHPTDQKTVELAANHYAYHAAKAIELSTSEKPLEYIHAAITSEYARGILDGICAILTQDFKRHGRITKGSPRAVNRAHQGGVKRKENHEKVMKAIHDWISITPVKGTWNTVEDAVKTASVEISIQLSKNGIYPSQKAESIEKKINTLIQHDHIAWKRIHDSCAD